MYTLRAASLFLILILVVSGCDSKQTTELQKTIEEKVSGAIDEISKNSSPPLEEVKKLSQLEYHMEAFDLESEPNIVKEKLNDLGKERWDCFSSFARPRSKPETPEMVVLCKRMPETVLRHVPRSLFGR